MPKTKREKIIETAKDLFYRYDYNSVSMRDISNKLGISVGNLTYYFSKKEDLIEEIIMEQHSHYKKFDTPENLMDLHDFFIHILDNQKERTFYFKHYNQLADISTQVYEFQLNVIGDLNQSLLTTYNKLKGRGLVDGDLDKDNINGIINSIVTLCIYGLTHFKRTKGQNPGSNLLKTLDTIVYLSLSNKGRDEYREFI